MTPEDLDLVDTLVQEFKQKLLEVGYLSRINQAQRGKLKQAHDLVTRLPTTLRVLKPEGSMEPDESTKWRLACRALSQVHPNWRDQPLQSRGETFLVPQAISQLVHPDFRPKASGQRCHSLRELAVLHYGQEVADDYFNYLYDPASHKGV